LLPNASRAFRRPPTLRTPKIHVPALSGTRVLVATYHHLQCFDLVWHADVLIWVGDTMEMGVRDTKVTALGFGLRVWVALFGPGHLIELDLDAGEVMGTRFGAHAVIVTHIFQHQNTMVSIDESAKMLVFEPTATSGSEVPSLTYATPQMYRIAEKRVFLKLLGGLWTSVRSDTNGSGPTTVPIVRIYNVFTPGSIARTASVLPNIPHNVGAVTSGTLLQSHAEFTYLGHRVGSSASV
ncbi:hypothetical protein EDB19DRAFT_1705248, partial [Suillus lakei]